MTQRNDPAQSYRKVSTQTASPGYLVLMLYDGAIGFLEKGLTGFEYSNPAEFNQIINNNVLRAQAIIHEMNARLDMERGGEMSGNFRQLYGYFYRRLQEGNWKKKKTPIEEVLGQLRGLRESWAEMLHRRQGTDSDPALPPAELELRLA